VEQAGIRQPALLEHRSEFIQRLLRMHIGGSLSLNWRNVGPRQPGFETQIQNEVYLADLYFTIDGPFLDGIPVQMEWNMPTGSQGQIRLNQLNFKFNRVDDLVLQFGKFVVPFGRYNELYRPDQFLAVTRPLLYSSPDSLDLVVRPNSPRPPISTGYTDIGARFSYYPPPADNPLVPEELTFFVVNGLGETSNRSRVFPDPDNLGIPPIPANGVNIDFGHRNNNLADNNNAKSVGARAVFALGDLHPIWPIPEGALDLKLVSVGFSAMGGQYDLEGELNYQMYGFDFNFDYFGLNFSGEYMYSTNQFQAPLNVSSAPFTTLADPVQQMRNREIIHGFFVQTSFPLVKRPRIGDHVTGVLVFNQMYRRGPQLDLLLNYNDGTRIFPSLLAYNPRVPCITTRIDKYTAAVNYQLTDYFQLKFDYSYWVMANASNRSINSLGLVDIYQGAMSLVLAF
jgi:hypothetical protein